MMTKAEELKALAKIQKILEEAGADSYIGMAFNGCVEMAKSNIENDFGNDPKEALDTAKRQYEEAKKEANEYKEAYRVLRERYEEEKAEHKADLFKMQTTVDNLKIERDSAQYNEVLLKAKEDEIIKLKARLYDLMVAE